jgi:hypothetical protein
MGVRVETRRGTEPVARLRKRVAQYREEKKLTTKSHSNLVVPMGRGTCVYDPHLLIKLPEDGVVAKLEKLLGDASEGKRNEP